MARTFFFPLVVLVHAISANRTKARAAQSFPRLCSDINNAEGAAWQEILSDSVLLFPCAHKNVLLFLLVTRFFSHLEKNTYRFHALSLFLVDPRKEGPPSTKRLRFA